jgi:hypothetical protein
MAGRGQVLGASTPRALGGLVHGGLCLRSVLKGLHAGAALRNNEAVTPGAWVDFRDDVQENILAYRFSQILARKLTRREMGYR